MQPAGAGDGRQQAARRVAMQREERAVTCGRDREAGARRAPSASAVGAVSSGAAEQSAMPWPMHPAVPAGWISRPVAASRCSSEIALPEAEATYRSRPPGARASAEGCARARAVAQPRPPPRRMQPVCPGCCESAPVVASRCRTATASMSLAAA